MNSRRLDIASILATARRLHDRVDARFPTRGINGLAAELVAIGTETEARVERLSRPRWALRLGLAGAVVLAIVVVVLAASRVPVDVETQVRGIDQWLELTETAIQDLVFIGIAAVFLAGVEGRLKRRDYLAGLHELRSFAHVIDMHQLTKDPDAALHPGHDTVHSPDRSLDPFELGRYLDYCSEMLSITSKLAGLHAQDTQDRQVWSAVSDVQDLVGSLSAKIWQKMMILDQPRAASTGSA